MTSPLTICSQALLKIGVEKIDSNNMQSKQAQVAQEYYPRLRDETLSLSNWSFALRDSLLVASSDKNVTPFSSQFVLPADLIRLVEITDDNIRTIRNFRVSNKRLFCNSPMVSINYVARVLESEFPAFFVKVLILKLAAEFAQAILNDLKLSQGLENLALASLSQAKKIDNSQNPPLSLLNDYAFINSRK